MRKLSKHAFQVSSHWIQQNGRPLEKALYRQRFAGGTETSVLEALGQYQNEDGGFGNGLEADFGLPASSPLATSVALQHLVDYDQNEQADEMITKAIFYLENTFDETRRGWYAVPEEVNHYPHAFWWKVHGDGMSWIDHDWGNPSAEIISYMVRYQDKVKSLNVEKCLDYAIDHLLQLRKFESEHEIYCYLRLFHLLPEHQTGEVKKQLQHAVQSLVNFDKEKWKEYVPFPLRFVHSPVAETFGIPSEKIDENLDYFIEQLETHGKMIPNWRWNDYLDVWEQAKIEWTGVLTLDVLQTLQRFNRMET